MNFFYITLVLLYIVNVVLSRPNNSSINLRIVGGKPALPRQFPYQVGLSVRKGQKTSWCGGAIISKDYIITAAHCLYGGTEATAFFGSHNKGSIYQTGNLVVQLGFWNFIIHKSFEFDHLKNDIALIKLPQPLEFNSNICPVKLPNNDIYSEGLKVIASGWGRLNDLNRAGAGVLHYVMLNLISLEKCGKTYGSKNIRSEHLCADGTNKRSTCQGDSGGPVVTEINNTKVLIGVVTFGGDGCEKGYPSVFTRVHSYLDWILENTGIQI